MRAQNRNVTPHHAGGENQRVIAVTLGTSLHHREKTGFQFVFDVGERERLLQRALQHHVVQPDVGSVLWLDVIGALVDDAEAHVFQHRNALGQRDGTAVAENFQSGSGILGAVIGMKLDREWMLGGERFDRPDIGNRVCRLNRPRGSRRETPPRSAPTTCGPAPACA